VSRKERELLEPVKRQASEAIEDLGAKIGDKVDRAQEKIAGGREESSSVETGSMAGDGRPLTH
jgi:hypothetical protein